MMNDAAATKVGGSEADLITGPMVRARALPTLAEVCAHYEAIRQEVRDNLVRRAQGGCEAAREQLWACW